MSFSYSHGFIQTLFAQTCNRFRYWLSKPPWSSCVKLWIKYFKCNLFVRINRQSDQVRTLTLPVSRGLHPLNLTLTLCTVYFKWMHKRNSKHFHLTSVYLSIHYLCCLCLACHWEAGTNPSWHRAKGGIQSILIDRSSSSNIYTSDMSQIKSRNSGSIRNNYVK